MKILHVYKTYYPESQGGVEHFIRTLTRHTAKLGCTNQLLTLGHLAGKTTFDEPELKVTRYSRDLALRSCPLSYAMLKNFKRQAAAADLLHYHFPWPFADFAHLANQIQTPAIITYHSDIVKQRILKLIYQPLGNHFLKKMLVLVATSPNYLATSPILQKFRTKTRVIPVGIDEQDYLPLISMDKTKLPAHISSDYFLFVGVLRYYKGLHILLAAMQTITRPLIIAGTGPCEAALKKLTLKLKLANVFFLGYITDNEKTILLSRCRAVIFPSHLRSEAFGITLVEGLLFGKPLVSCEIGTGTSYVNQHDVTGLVVPPENPLALQAALTKLSIDDNLITRMGAAARSRYQTLFTAEKMAATYVELYRTVLSASSVAVH